VPRRWWPLMAVGLATFMIYLGGRAVLAHLRADRGPRPGWTSPVILGAFAFALAAASAVVSAASSPGPAIRWSRHTPRER
jgi:hypothetical protein